MKVQCACGVKHEFELTPEMASNPVRFTCPACGLDASEFVDGLIRQELGQASAPRGVPIPIALGGAAPAAPPAPARPAVAVRIHTREAVAEEAAEAGPRCLKHGGEPAVEKCYACAKPICPQCMELFGYVCSPLCKAKAEARGITLPVYAGQKVVVEARQWRRLVHASWAVGLLGVALLGFWFWYAWFGSAPKAVFSVRFPERAYSGRSFLCGQEKDQLVFLRGATLARYDLKSKQQVWACELLNRKEIDDAVKEEMDETRKLIDKANNEAWEHVPKMPDAEKLAREYERSLAAEMELHVKGRNLWVASPKKVVRFDWETGKQLQEIPIDPKYGGLLARGDELVTVDTSSGKAVVTRINLVSCESSTEQLGGAKAAGSSATGAVATVRTGSKQELAGLPRGTPGKDTGKPMDPAKVAEQVSHLSYPEKLALPATVAANLNQERALAQLDDAKRQGAGGADALPNESLIATRDGFVRLSVKLLEERIVTRDAMKAAPAKTLVDSGNVTAGNSLEAASELLNEMQRERGGGTVEEDESRYQVTLRRPGIESEWTGEVVGPPSLYPLESVNVLTANKQVIVLDKENRKLWQSALTYNVESGLGALDEESAAYGQGPCVEHKGCLYVMDEGVLTAFDLTNGVVRWRYPSVGIAGVFFDDKDMMYVNTTTASLTSIKYSRQIDLSSKTVSVIVKLDSRTGKVIWSTQPGGLVNYVSGKYIYTLQSYAPLEDEENSRIETGFEARPYMRIRRLSPKDGRELWQHYEERAPLDVAFDQNTIRLVFRKEVCVLKFLSL